MGFKKVKSIEEPKKVEVKQKITKEPVSVQKVKEKLVTKTDVAVTVDTAVSPGNKLKPEWEGVGIIGNTADINTFKGLVKMKGKKMGDVLLTLIKEWNEKNKL